jgi:integrase
VSGKFQKAGTYLQLHTGTGFYYVRKSFRRLRIPDLFATTKEKRKQKAQAIADQMIADHMARYLNSDSSLAKARSGKRISEVIAEILKIVTPEKRPGTQAMHRIYLGELNKEWGVYEVSRMSLSLWSNWLAEFRLRKNRGTFDDYVKSMNIVLRYAYNQKYCSHLLSLPPADKKKKKAGRVYSPAEILALWDAMNEETRDQFSLSYECFMRLREALYLEWNRVDLKTGEITLRPEDVKTGSKTGKGRSFLVSPTALLRLRARYDSRASQRWVFPSPTDPDQAAHSNKTAWNTAKRNAGVKGKARWHDLRHTAISRSLLEAGADLVQVSEYAGVSIRTLQRVYLHSTAAHTASVSNSVKIR